MYMYMYMCGSGYNPYPNPNTNLTTPRVCANPDPHGPGKLRYACAAVVFVGLVPLRVEIFPPQTPAYFPL